MKIRIKGNSIRFRLTQTEVKQLYKKSVVTERTHFSLDSLFEYTLEAYSGNEIQGSFKNGRIAVHIPDVLVRNWATTDRVGLSRDIPIANDKRLFILIEKDFKCLVDRPGEEDMFPHPKEHTHQC